MRRVWIVLVVLGAVACASPPPAAIETEHGSVRGWHASEVERVAAALKDCAEIRELLGSTRAAPPEIWLLETGRTSTGAFGTCYSDRITLAKDALSPDETTTLRYYVAHEVAHWYTNDSPYESLPIYLKEGLADFVALERVGLQDARRLENDEIAKVAVDPRDLSADIAQLTAMPSEYGIAIQRIGYEVVARLGLPALRELAARDTHPLGYLEAAQMTPSIALARTVSSRKMRLEITWFDADGREIGSRTSFDGIAGSFSGKLPEGAEAWALELEVSPPATLTDERAHGHEPR